jgi:tRNA (guanine37-N1)-methyltransferase
LKLGKTKSGLLRQGIALPSYDVVGDIVIIRLRRVSRVEAKIIAHAVMQRRKSVKTVLGQVGAVTGDLRLRRLQWVRGERKYVTVYREHGCILKVDLKNCYFSPRLSYERKRIACVVKPNETIVNMFAGAGSFSIPMAKLGSAKRVFSVDINPIAVELIRENARLNRVENRVVPIQGDAKDVIMDRLRGVADRVVMPLPMKAYAYLDYAVAALKSSGGWIHYYDFEHASKTEDPVEKVKMKAEEKLRKLGVSFSFSLGRVVRSVGPRWYQVVVDIFVSESRDV